MLPLLFLCLAGMLLAAWSASSLPKRFFTVHLDPKPRPGVRMVLLHGFCANFRQMLPLADSLWRLDGVGDVLCINYRTDGIEAMGGLVEAMVDAVQRACTVTNQNERPSIVVVGITLGGVVARFLAQRLGEEGYRVGLVTIATPNAGVPLMDSSLGSFLLTHCLWGDAAHYVTPLASAALPQPPQASLAILARSPVGLRDWGSALIPPFSQLSDMRYTRTVQATQASVLYSIHTESVIEDFLRSQGFLDRTFPPASKPGRAALAPAPQAPS